MVLVLWIWVFLAVIAFLLARFDEVVKPVSEDLIVAVVQATTIVVVVGVMGWVASLLGLNFSGPSPTPTGMDF